ERIPAVTTGQIYKGSIAFIVLQIIMVAVVLFNPGLVSSGITKVKQLSDENVQQQLLNLKVEDYGSKD
ncbi:MAG: C4-dicarboxylate ABC transporter, partial [Burkholderiaceae bacterium]